MTEDFKKQVSKDLKFIEKNVKGLESEQDILKSINNIMSLFYLEFEKLIDLYSQKMEYLANTQKILSDRVNELERSMNEIEQDIYEDSLSELNIICPYCNNEFYVDMEEDESQEIKCPECGNTIELFFGEDDDCRRM